MSIDVTCSIKADILDHPIGKITNLTQHFPLMNTSSNKDVEDVHSCDNASYPRIRHAIISYVSRAHAFHLLEVYSHALWAWLFHMILFLMQWHFSFTEVEAVGCVLFMIPMTSKCADDCGTSCQSLMERIGCGSACDISPDTGCYEDGCECFICSHIWSTPYLCLSCMEMHNQGDEFV